MAFDIGMIKNLYAAMPAKTGAARKVDQPRLGLIAAHHG